MNERIFPGPGRSAEIIRTPRPARVDHLPAAGWATADSKTAPVDPVV